MPTLGKNEQYDEWAFDFKTAVGSRCKELRDVLEASETQGQDVKAKEVWANDPDKARELDVVRRMAEIYSPPRVTPVAEKIDLKEATNQSR